MRQERYRQIENYMLSCMRDSAHDCQHVYRVLYGALEIARCEAQPDMDALGMRGQRLARDAGASCFLAEIGKPCGEPSGIAAALCSERRG